MPAFLPISCKICKWILFQAPIFWQWSKLRFCIWINIILFDIAKDREGFLGRGDCAAMSFPLVVLGHARSYYFCSMLLPASCYLIIWLCLNSKLYLDIHFFLYKFLFTKKKKDRKIRWEAINSYFIITPIPSFSRQEYVGRNMLSYS